MSTPEHINIDPATFRELAEEQEEDWRSFRKFAAGIPGLSQALGIDDEDEEERKSDARLELLNKMFPKS